MKNLKRHVYRVTADTKKGNHRTWAIDIWANNKEEAIHKAKVQWKLEMHLFNAKAERKQYDELDFEFWKMTYETKIIDGKPVRVWKGE